MDKGLSFKNEGKSKKPYDVNVGSKVAKPLRFAMNLNIVGENAEFLRKNVEAKQARESRSTLSNTVESILVDYFRKNPYTK